MLFTSHTVVETEGRSEFELRVDEQCGCSMTLTEGLRLRLLTCLQTFLKKS
jgi:hypothetical protein